MNEVLGSISRVMFNEYFKQTAYVEKSVLSARLTEIINLKQLLTYMIESKMYNIIDLNNAYSLIQNQQNNYLAFVSSLGKKMNGVAEERLVYKYMSFGLIEYYSSIVDSILGCIEIVPYFKMNVVEKYFKKYFYIQLKRLQKLFDWILNEYLEDEKTKETEMISNGTFNRKTQTVILKKKIEILKTKKDVKNILMEFNGFKTQLDQYQATLMPPVSLHLRINDFKDDRNNSPDPDTDTDEYKWNEASQVFYNGGGNEKNKLLVNTDILSVDSSGTVLTGRTRADWSNKYPRVVTKMNVSSGSRGIPFERIYNTKFYPDADIISNYMSLAPNIMNNKGTMIMTYGYSGTGKSATLFGVIENPAKGITAKSGILQTTMDQIENATIWFRVFEIYGLGTQFDFEWNPSTAENLDDIRANPKFYQMIIHHNLESTGGKLKNKGQVPITNQADMFAYIMNMQYPRDADENELQFQLPNPKCKTMDFLLKCELHS